MRIGMGALGQSCDAITNWLCSLRPASVQAGTPPGTLCSPCAVPPPTLAPGSTSPGLPVGYDDASGTVDDSNVGGATVANPYAVSYPNLGTTCLALFGETTCWGPLGSTTWLALGGSLGLAYWLLGRKR